MGALDRRILELRHLSWDYYCLARSHHRYVCSTESLSTTPSLAASAANLRPYHNACVGSVRSLPAATVRGCSTTDKYPGFSRYRTTSGPSGFPGVSETVGQFLDRQRALTV